MSSANPEVLPSTLEEVIQMGDIPSEDNPRSKPSSQEISQLHNQHSIPEDEESSATRSFESVTETCPNGQDDLPTATQDVSVNSVFPEVVLQATDDDSDESSDKKGLISKENRVVLTAGCFNSRTFLEKAESTGYCQELSEGADLSGDVESSSTRIFEKELESCTDGQDDIFNPTEDELPNLTEIFVSISTETSGKKDSDSTSPLISLSEYSDRKSFLERSGPTDFISLQLSHEIGSSIKLPSLVSVLDSSNTSTVPSLACDDKVKQNTPDKIDSNTFNQPSSELNFPSFEMNSSLRTPEDMPIPNPHVTDKCRKDGNDRLFVFVNTETFSNDLATSSHDTPIMHSFPTHNSPPVSSAKPITEEEHKSLNHESQPSVSSGIISDKNLTYMLSTLENWAKKGLENTFNRSLNNSYKDIVANLKKDIQNGLDVIKDMSERIYALIKAASKLPDPFTPQHSEFRGDLIRAALTLWHTIDDLKFAVCHVYKTVYIDDTDSENCDKIDGDQEVSSNIVITNACTLVTERLDLLRTQLEDFRGKIRVFCSEMDKLL